jgi:soluble lytic murein transglycosylase-like protein
MNVNSMDPQLITAWLKTQFWSTSDITSASLGASGAVGTDGPSADFPALLQLLTAPQGNGTKIPASADASVFSNKLAPLASNAPLSLAALSAPAAAGAQVPAPVDVEEIIRAASEKYGVHPSLVRAVIQVESGFRPDAESHAGAKGFMQLMDATAKSLGVTDSFDPIQNIHGGTRFLSYLITKYNGNESVALAAYNAGPGRVDRLGIRTDADLAESLHRLPKETQAYVAKVLHAKA